MNQVLNPANEKDIDEKEIAHLAVPQNLSPIGAYDQFSNFTVLKRVTTRIFRFINNCRIKIHAERNKGYFWQHLSCRWQRTIGSELFNVIILNKT